MLMRSSSSPILKSHLPQSKNWPLESDHLLKKSKSFSFNPTNSFHHFNDSKNPKPRNMVPLLTQNFEIPKTVKTLETSMISAQNVFLKSGFGLKMENYDGFDGKKDDECVLKTMVVGGGMGNNGGRILCGGGGGGGSDGVGGGGGGGGGGDDDRSEFFENDKFHGSKITDVYYQRMIQAYPGSGVILGNYAKFLKEVRGDLVKAEEYCGKAILADPNDGIVLLLYGDIIWHLKKDAQLAKTYFLRALDTSPEDCFFVASYATFLWEADDDEEDNKADRYETEEICPSPPGFPHGPPYPSPLTTAS